MNHALKHHLQTHPALLPRDAVKFCYQAAFGGGHLITDHDRAAQYLCTERAALTPDPALPLTEPLGGGLVRLNLASPKASSFSDSAILRVFAHSAKVTLAREDNRTRFDALLDELTALACANETPFSAEALSDYLNDYRAAGCPVVSHTEDYRTAYRPAYRVIEEQYVPLLPLITAIDALIDANPDRCVTVAVDGHAASGKSTLAVQLSGLYDCNVFHMDDYFLPYDRRTSDRLAEPGGNVDYERFRAEILDSILAGEPVTHAAFDCQSGTFFAPVTEEKKTLAIIEGSYAHHPYFGDAYDLRIALDITEEEQQRRILSRNGERMLAMFVDRWIPMEHRYFDAFRIFENADIIYTTNNRKD